MSEISVDQGMYIHRDYIHTQFQLKERESYNGIWQCSVPPTTVRISEEKFPMCLLHSVVFPLQVIRVGLVRSVHGSHSLPLIIAALLCICFPCVLFQRVTRTVHCI